MPIRFIMAVTPLDIYVAWYNFTARLQSIFQGASGTSTGWGMRIFPGFSSGLDRAGRNRGKPCISVFPVGGFR
jgi:hypothetical protein